MNNEQIYEKKNVVVEKYFYGEKFYCPSCGKHLGSDYDDLNDMNYCQKCGQALEWDNKKFNFKR